MNAPFAAPTESPSTPEEPRAVPLGASRLSSQPPTASRQWHAGTLTYTSAGLVVLFCWLLWGDFAWNLKERSIGDVMKLVLKLHNASDFLVGLFLSTLPTALGLLIGPVISYKSDRHRGKWGRRIPYLLIPTPIGAAALVFLAYSPSIGSHLHSLLGSHSPGENACVLTLIGLSWGVFEAATLISNTVFGALINDVVPQQLMGRFYGFFRAVSIGCAIVFNWYILGHAEQWYFYIFIGLAIVYGVGFTLMCLRVKEGQYPPPPPVTRSPGDLPLLPPGMKQYFIECFSSPYYLLVFGTLAVVTAGMAPGGIYSLYFAKSVNLNLDTFGKLNSFAFFFSFALAIPLGYVADRFHPVRVGFLLVCILTAFNFLMSAFATTATTFAIGHVTLTIVSGMYYTVTASINQRLLPRSKFAQYACALGIIISFSTLWVAPVVGLLLDFTNHNYRNAYLVGSFLLLASVALWALLWKQFNSHGGINHYHAPGDPPTSTSDI
jgi:MFS family permease